VEKRGLAFSAGSSAGQNATENGVANEIGYALEAEIHRGVWIPASGLAAEHYNWAFEIATACFTGLAMTCERRVCHCEEQGDEAISPLATNPSAGITTKSP
jgi:hypothetical protein